MDVSLINSVFCEVKSYCGLETLLKKSTEGNIILLNKGKLSNDHRQKLANISIGELFALYGPEVNSNTILKVAQEISEVFPYESSDAYMISSQDGGPKGKLWNRYNNVRKALQVANAHKKENVPSTSKTSSPEIPEVSVLLDFLKVGTEPHTKVVHAWEKTSKLRKKTYANCSVSEIYKDFPCLSLNTGIELIESDFNMKFSEKMDVIYSTWPKISLAILKEIQERKIKLLDDRHCEETIIIE